LYNELTALRDYHTRGSALWYLGSEDPSIWSFFNKDSIDGKYNPDLLRRIDFKNSYNVDTASDSSELMKVASLPTPGERSLTLDSDGLIVKEDYSTYPLPYLLRQFGPSGKVIALTFDDGPDPTYTPQILRILRQRGIHGTFFMVGENVTQHPQIVKQLWDEGNEIGNHTFTHPHISLVSSLRMEFELNATERILESIIGHRTLLFRPPFGEMPDISGITALHTPQILQLQQAGYITVGMNIDPKDYESPSTDEILDRIDKQLKNNHIILLHDGGGNRENTVKALPFIISHLQAQGYQFMTVSQLIDHYHGAGKQSHNAHADLFPIATNKEMEAASFDRFIFTTIFFISCCITFIFLLAIFLGVFRIILFSILAVKQRRRLAKLPTVAEFHPTVTVVIPAYNEGVVVCNTVQSVLESSYPNLEIMVVDDGSTDDTFIRLQEKYAAHPQVTLIHKENGGKSTALNLALERATGEIIVSMDADTIFLPSTIRNLVRQFIDPQVGAVAGNVKVGNRINILTIWQSIEYITNQNFDRLAFAAMNSVPVIPGAVGAWRREAIQKAGGFEDNTLAEDTDLTFKIRCLGYHTCCDNDAIAYTEAPDSIRQLAKQRFRWSFGILQALWKHRHKLFRPKYGAFGSFVMPSMWIYNIFLQAIAPLVDLSVLYLIFTGDFMQVVFYLSVFFVLDLLAAFIAMRFDNEKSSQLVWLFWQRFFYREFMYFVILRSLFTAMRGGLVGWGNLQRRATVSMPKT
jgi:cellulose synthase/poly-beta-1,6-N-acetylglucosamine synthase-like glycosyltransferase/peptidoglycan/xylan/chitin deacetylase (PgdA/CDA1 family)